MKNQYFADINDFRKYGILRGLAGPPLRLAVSWMLTPDDEGRDGNFRSYLDQRDVYKFKDPELFSFLRKEVDENRKTGVASLEHSGIVRDAWFVSTILDGKVGSRERWLNQTMRLASPRSLVFFDPDNGLEVKSVRKGSSASSKYLYWDEVEQIWSTGSSLLIYQHFIRENRDKFLKRLAAEFRRRLQAPDVSVLRTANVGFFLVPQKHDLEILLQRAEQLANHWAGQIRIEHL
jgi:hypothetical protein